MAVMSGMYAAYHGPEGIREIAMNAFNYAHAMAALLSKGGYRLANEDFFDRGHPRDSHERLQLRPCYGSPAPQGWI